MNLIILPKKGGYWFSNRTVFQIMTKISQIYKILTIVTTVQEILELAKEPLTTAQNKPKS